MHQCVRGAQHNVLHCVLPVLNYKYSMPSHARVVHQLPSENPRAGLTAERTGSTFGCDSFVGECSLLVFAQQMT